MGICVQCGKKSMNMSYSCFDRFRMKIAKTLNKKFGEAYEQCIFEKTVPIKEFEKICMDTEELTQELFDFFMASDCEGKINRDTVRQLVPIIEKMDEFTIGYIGVEPYNKQATLDFFRHSIRYGANVTWG